MSKGSIRTTSKTGAPGDELKCGRGRGRGWAVLDETHAVSRGVCVCMEVPAVEHASSADLLKNVKWENVCTKPFLVPKGAMTDDAVQKLLVPFQKDQAGGAMCTKAMESLNAEVARTQVPQQGTLPIRDCFGVCSCDMFT